jgi:hypothetical protein
MIFAKKKILVWYDDPQEDRVIPIFVGCLPNHDRVHIHLEIFRGDWIVVLFYIWNPISIRELLEESLTPDSTIH